MANRIRKVIEMLEAKEEEMALRPEVTEIELMKMDETIKRWKVFLMEVEGA